MTRHPAILEAATVSVPDAKYGEVVGAWIVRQPGGIISRDEVRKCVSDNMNPQVSYPNIKRSRLLLWGNRQIECSCLGLVRGGRWGPRGAAKNGKWQGHETRFAEVESRSHEARGRTNDITRDALIGDVITQGSSSFRCYRITITIEFLIWKI